jgi:YjbE family integral membrane protein
LDLGIAGQIQFSWDFVTSFLSIILINLILSGDNAVVIAMAVRSLRRKQRMRVIAFGAGLAVILRVILTFFAAQLLQIQFIKFIGGAVIIWIAIQLFIEATPEDEVKKEDKTLWQAIWVILVADLTMSTDNVLAVAGASKGNLFLLVFGLGLSVPLVLFTSNLLSMLMDKYAFLVYLGAAVLGRVGGEMMISDPFIIARFHPSTFLQYGVEAFFTIGVLVAGKAWVKLKVHREERRVSPQLPGKPHAPARRIDGMAILTLSREYQNGAPEIGRAVADQLGYDFVDRHCIYDHLSAAGEKWGRLARELDEERPSLWEKYDREYRGFIALIESTIYDYAAMGHAVILGRGSAFLLHDIPQVLKVRLYAPLEVRIERVMQNDNLDRKTAEAVIEKIDKSRTGYVQSIYGKQLKDWENYDLIFNTGIQTYEQVTRDLVEILKEWDQRATPESRQQLKDRALAARVKALLYTHPEVFIPTLEIFPDGSAIVLKGLVHGPQEYHLIEEIARETAGDYPLRNELRYRS